MIYFGLHHWSLPYEQIADPQFQVPRMHRWGAWGRQRGVDLQKLAAHSEVDIIICETYPPVAANLENFVAEFARITRSAGKTFGVMLHRDDKWALKLRRRTTAMVADCEIPADSHRAVSPRAHVARQSILQPGMGE